MGESQRDFRYKELMRLFRKAQKFTTRGRDFKVERTGVKPDLVVPELALWHHSPRPQRAEGTASLPSDVRFLLPASCCSPQGRNSK